MTERTLSILREIIWLYDSPARKPDILPFWWRPRVLVFDGTADS